jgi:hypothetical protein
MKLTGHEIVEGTLSIPRSEGLPRPVWQGKRDDKTARVADYCLRAEMMDRGVWWWNVSYKGEDIGGSCWDTEVPQTGKAAMAKAEAVMDEHNKKSKA